MKILMVTNQVKRYNSGCAVVIEPLLELGHEVFWAANFGQFVGDIREVSCECCHIDIQRNPLHWKNLRAYRQLLQLIKQHQIDAIYCSTPIGGLLGRIVGWRMGVKKVIYAAHGFTFYHGAPWWWNFIFKSEELALARVTDVLITINDEDMEAAQKFKLRGKGHVYQIGGAGVEEHYPCQKEPEQMRKELGIPKDAIVLVSAGALNKRKNYAPIIEAISVLEQQKLFYLICGEGPYYKRLKRKISKKGLQGKIRLLGYRTDVLDVMRCADIFVLSSFREGLPRVTMEAMALGLPCIVSDIRGNRDLITQGENGYICEADNIRQYEEAICRLAEDGCLREKMGRSNVGKLRTYTTKVVRQQMYGIFSTEFSGESGDKSIDGNE
ncbi:glycosyltransferase family 4 protein [uncultured Dysosmobacter sp.]|uniref:glycosyltransferase family 4 protein n=1 Tax=uncultured Dysosmobacter sp. TaxID=2591384 RepID=UPI0026140BDF|nr:glycosyltransferase family 4 protein [uncultured Dysosmobacter sp.]